MHPYSFIVSLRANHPNLDLSFLAGLLSLERRNGWTAGDERKTPKGTSLGGIRNESFWSARVTAEETSSEQWQLEDVLERSVAKIGNFESELAEFYASGGTMSYFVGLYGVRNYGLNLSPDLMRKLANAKVELQLDIYPYQSAV